MPVTAVPAQVELLEMRGGFAPDPEEVSLEWGSSPDVLNLLPDRASGALELRKGFARLLAGRLDLQGYWIRHVSHYAVIVSGVQKHYIVCVLSNGTAAANNVQIYVYDLDADTFSRVDTAGRTWANSGKSEHWHAVVEGTLYGGTQGEKIYSWHPTAGWKADPTTLTALTWVDAVDGGVNPTTQYGRDFAFNKNQKVAYLGKFYATTRGIRFKEWENDQKYDKGEQVSRKATISGVTYWRSYACVQGHTSSASKRPGDGTGTWRDYWKKVRLRNVQDSDGKVTKDWVLVPPVGKSSVGIYHGYRVWIRHDDADNWSRLQYSAEAAPESDADIADLDWQPTDWSPTDDIDKGGGGWLNIPFTGGDQINALYSYGNHLIISGDWQTYVLSGTDENTWNLRKLGNHGAVGSNAVTELGGRVYMLGRRGVLTVTDGTSMSAVPGSEKVREWLKERMDTLFASSTGWTPGLISYSGLLIITLPGDGVPGDALVYDPESQSFWLLDVPILDTAVGAHTGAERLWFSTAVYGGASQRPAIFQYTDDPGDEVWTDDDWQAATGVVGVNAISWRYRSGWVQFGALRMDRRLRRSWALIRGDAGQIITLQGYRNLELASPSFTATRTLAGGSEAEFIEGKTLQAAHAFGFKLSGTSTKEVAVQGIGADTEPVRVRYKRS